MTKAEDQALADSLKFGSGPYTHNQGHAPLSADPFGIYPGAETELAEPAPEKES